MPKFEIIQGKEDSPEQNDVAALRKQLRELADEHSAHIGLHPKWCVWGTGPEMGAGVLYWIKPGQGDQFIAEKMSQIINKMGGDARAEMTEWNEERIDPPVHKRKGGLNYIINNIGKQE